MNTIVTLALIVGGSIIIQLVGMLWYGPLFGHAWMTATGTTEQDMKMTKEQSRVIYGGSFVAGIVISTLLYLAALGSEDMKTMAIAVLITVVFAASVSVSSYLFEKRSLHAWVIHYGFVAVSTTLVGILMMLVV